MEENKKSNLYTIKDIADDIQNILAKYQISVSDINKVLDDCIETIRSRTIVKPITTITKS